LFTCTHDAKIEACHGFEIIITPPTEMLTYIIFFAFPIIIASAQVKHGDIVVFHDLVVSAKDNRAYRRQSAPSTRFMITKEPYYPSKNNVIMTGKTVGLRVFNTTRTCEYTAQRMFQCARSSAYLPSTIRILDKHGKDNIPLQSDSLIKFRMPKINIDCSAWGSQPLSCVTKRPQETYGFVISNT
jgi:hypothetical protein